VSNFNTTKVPNFLMGPIEKIITKTVRAYHGSSMDATILSNFSIRIDHRSRINNRTFSNFYFWHNNSTRINLNLICDLYIDTNKYILSNISLRAHMRFTHLSSIDKIIEMRKLSIVKRL